MTLPRFTPDPDEKMVEVTRDPVSSNLLVRSKGEARFYDPKSLKMVDAVQMGVGSPLLALRATPDGERLVGLDTWDLVVCSRQTGELLHSRSIKRFRTGGPMLACATTYERYFEVRGSEVAFADSSGLLLRMDIRSGRWTRECIGGPPRLVRMDEEPGDREYLPPPSARGWASILYDDGEVIYKALGHAQKTIARHASDAMVAVPWAHQVGSASQGDLEVVAVGSRRLSIVHLPTMNERPITVRQAPEAFQKSETFCFAGWLRPPSVAYVATLRALFLATLEGDDATIVGLRPGFHITSVLPMPERDALAVGGLFGNLVMVPVDAMTP